MEVNKKELKLIYIDVYFRIDEKTKDGNPITDYATITGTVSGGFSEEQYTKYKNIIKNSHENDGYIDISINKCSKEEFEMAKSNKTETEIAPLGYLRAYFNTVFVNGNEEMYAPFYVEYDFNTFFSEDIWDMIANSLNTYYERRGMKQVKTVSITEEFFNYLEKDSDETTIFNFN